MKSFIGKNHTELRLCFWNVGGLGDKLEDDLFLSEVKQNDIILLAETHIGYDKKVSVEEYHYFPVCRPKSANGRYYGGLAILTRLSVRPYVSFLRTTSTEYQWIKFDKKFFNFQKDLFLCLAYIPPSQSIYTNNMQQDLLDLLEKDISLYKTKGDIMICGDLNARTGNRQDFIVNDGTDHLPLYQNYNVDHPPIPRQNCDVIVDSRGRNLIDICIGNQLRILNGRCFGDLFGRYTCYTPNGCSVVDYTIVSESILDQVLFFQVSDFIATLSDCHSKISWGILANFNCSNSVYKLNPLPLKYIWDENLISEFQSAFQTEAIQNKMNEFMNMSIADTNDSVDHLNRIITDAADLSLKSNKKRMHKTKHYSKKKSKKHKKWFDTDLKTMRNRVIANGKLYSMFPGDPIVRGRYFKLFRIYNKTKRTKERQFKTQMLEQIESLHSENPKEYWNLIDMLKDETFESSPAENIKPETWVSHFQSLATVDDKFVDRVSELQHLVKELEKQPIYNNLDNVIKSCEIHKAISNLKNNKAVGLDSISNEMIKAAQGFLAPCFLKLFNACLSSGQYPSQWSNGYITPLHKSDDSSDPSNYRGITITSAIGKVFNTILNNRLDSFLADKNFINECQIGFTKKARTADHMFILKCLIDKYCSRPGSKLYACFVDFRKAFDKVIHAGLKMKLLHLGVGTKFYNICKSMYNNSQSCVRLNNGLTKHFKSGIGVRQGDVLSPNLFKIFINDLPDYFHSCPDPVKLQNKYLHCLLYADDVVILSESATGLQTKLNKLENYCADWCLDINIDKTKIIIFNKAGRLLKSTFTYQNETIESVKSYRYLGIYFSASGSFSYAKSELYKKGLKAYFKLCKTILNLHPSIRTSLHIFDHTVKPILLYGCEIWGTFNPASAKFRNGISFDKIFKNAEPEKLNLKLSKFVLGVHRKSSNFAVLSELGRFPYYIDIVKASLKFWHRLENSDHNSLLSDALECSKSLAHTSNSWYNTIQQYSGILGMPLNAFIHMTPAAFNKKLSKLLKNKYLHEWYSTKESLAIGKLDTYTRIKNSFGFEKYLSSLHFTHRKDLTRLRISSHRLNIETGRYAGIERSDRICSKCSMGVLGDEIHFMLECPTYQAFREPLLTYVVNNCRNFNMMSNSNKYFWLLNCENEEIIQEIAKFVHMNLDQ